MCIIYHFVQLRVSKEKLSYEREVITNENKLEKMKQEGKDEYEIKKQVKRSKNIIIIITIDIIIAIIMLSSMLSNEIHKMHAQHLYNVKVGICR